MKKINLYIDLDDTLTKSTKRICEKIEHLYGKNYYNCKFLSPYKECSRDVINNIYSSKDFYENIDIVDNCIEILNDLKSLEFYNVNICTIGLKENLENKKKWILDKFNNISHIFGIQVKEDDFLNNDVWNLKKTVDMRNGIQIDDNINCLRCTNAKIKILINREYEDNYRIMNPDDNIYIVDNWKNIKAILDFYQKEGGIV